MMRAHYVQESGSEQVVDVPDGTSLMRAAILAGVPGIVGECGGQAMCATCHVYVDDDAVDDLPPVSVDEDEMLDSTASPRTERSRLSCQLIGLQCSEIVVHVPETQL